MIKRFAGQIAIFVGGVVLTVAAVAATVFYALPFDGDADLFAEAQRLSGRKCVADEQAAAEDGEHGGLCEPPAIQHADLSALNAYGLYDHTTNPRVVIVDMNAAPRGSAQYRETVIHEYVHYLQWVQGDLRPQGDPCSRGELEIEAHRVDQKYTSGGDELDERTKGIIFSYTINCLFWQQIGGGR